MEENAGQNQNDQDERYKNLVRAFLHIEKELDELKAEGFDIKHDLLKAIDHNKKKKIIDFINKL